MRFVPGMLLWIVGLSGVSTNADANDIEVFDLESGATLAMNGEGELPLDSEGEGREEVDLFGDGDLSGSATVEGEGDALLEDGAVEGALADEGAGNGEETEMTLTITPVQETPEQVRARILAEREAERKAERQARLEARKKRQEQIAEQRRKYWETHKHPPAYFNLLIFGGFIVEDGANRLTAHKRQTLQAGGLALRAGGIIDDMHLVGVRMQGIVRATKSVLDAGGSDNGDWGAVVMPFIGPEYRFLAPFGLYVGGSIGMAGIVAATDGRCDEDCFGDSYCEEECYEDHVRGVVSWGGILNVGYQLRVTRFFSMNIEVFGGFFRGVDSNDETMRNGIFGFGLGFGV